MIIILCGENLITRVHSSVCSQKGSRTLLLWLNIEEKKMFEILNKKNPINCLVYFGWMSWNFLFVIYSNLWELSSFARYKKILEYSWFFINLNLFINKFQKHQFFLITHLHPSTHLLTHPHAFLNHKNNKSPLIYYSKDFISSSI